MVWIPVVIIWGYHNLKCVAVQHMTRWGWNQSQLTTLQPLKMLTTSPITC